MKKTDRTAALDILARANISVAEEAGIELWSRGVPSLPTTHVGRGDLVVCLRATDPLVMPGNVTCACHECGDLIQHRPYLVGKGATMCCPTCAQKIVEGEKR